MRFCADGPSIPDKLLVARDEGQVVFFCGAGVSREAAGLPTFYELASQVAEDLGSATESPARKLIEANRDQARIAGVGGLLPADRVFALLEREFEFSDVRQAVARALRPAPDVDLAPHRTLLDLARTPDGRVRLITTNFDRLFEKCAPELEVHIPPKLPDPRRAVSFSGIIHLHGSVTNDYLDAVDDGFVLSSADFGRAYLSDGWATSFIRGVLSGFQVVFIGYAADDPPVQYLLEALGNRLPSSGLYAFQPGPIEEARALWRDRGVEAIAYESESSHSALWRTLEAWAARARSPETWYSQVLERSMAGPNELLPFERGQFKHLVATTRGARHLAMSEAPATWLCVLDPTVRYGRRSRPDEGGNSFDPFDAYGLDDDAIPAPANPDDYFAKREVPSDAWDGFAPVDEDRIGLSVQHTGWFRGFAAAGAPRLSARLEHLGVWLSKMARQPAAAWWAAGQTGLHPNVRGQIQRKLEQPDAQVTPVTKAWRYIFRCWGDQDDSYEKRWFDLDNEIKCDGWSAATVRAWATLVRPRIKTGQSLSGRPYPPTEESASDVNAIVYVDIVHYVPPSDVTAPDNLLSIWTSELRQNLELVVDLELETGGHDFYSLPSISPDANSLDDHRRTSGIAVPILRYIAAFERLIASDPIRARQESAYWHDDVVFNHIRAWAVGKKELMTAREAARFICAVGDELFWNSRSQRDLLLSLRERWTQFAVQDRKRIERRILKGPKRRENEDRPTYLRIRAYMALERLLWLASQGCDISDTTLAKLQGVRRFAPDWKDQQANTAVASNLGRSGWVGTIEDTSLVSNEPPGSLIEVARSLSGFDHNHWSERRPFDGIAKEKPVKVLRALVIAGKRNESIAWAWRTFLEVDARQSDSPRLMRAIAERISRLPEHVLAELVYPVCAWLRGIAPKLSDTAPETFGRVWSSILKVIENFPESGTSAITRSSSFDWVNSAINAPTGKLAESLMKFENKTHDDRGFSQTWLQRVSDLLSLKGDARHFSAIIFLFNLNFFFYHDRKWTEENLLSMIDTRTEDRDVFLSGFLWSNAFPTPSLLLRLRPLLLSLYAISSNKYYHVDRVSAFLLAGWANAATLGDAHYITNKEIREFLIAANDELRIGFLRQIKNWFQSDPILCRDLLIEFFQKVWPRQRVCKGARTSAHLVDFCLSTNDYFPEFATLITPLITHMDNHAMGFYELQRTNWKLLDDYPRELLVLVYASLSDDIFRWPYLAQDLVGRLAASPEIASDPRVSELRRRVANQGLFR